MSRDFTYDVWREICDTFISSGFVPLTIADYISMKHSSTLPKKYVILRHDIDRRPSHALAMAELEAENDIHSTYYFRVPYTFDKAIIRKISALGHEIGFHYECLSKTKGDSAAAVKLFGEELAMLRDCAEVKTICMHGRPASPYDNRDLWNEYSFAEYGVIGEAYLSISDVCYFTDTGRSWGSTNSVRDSLAGAKKHPVITGSDEFIAWISKTDECGIYVTAHPERWAGSFGDRVYCSMKDEVMGVGKKMLRAVK